MMAPSEHAGPAGISAPGKTSPAVVPGYLPRAGRVTWRAKTRCIALGRRRTLHAVAMLPGLATWPPVCLPEFLPIFLCRTRVAVTPRVTPEPSVKEGKRPESLSGPAVSEHWAGPSHGQCLQPHPSRARACVCTLTHTDLRALPRPWLPLLLLNAARQPQGGHTPG